MSRPREHDEQVAEVLLDAAEQLIAANGVDGLSLRAVAEDAGTTTRAIYTLFGSKSALVGALGVRAMHLLRQEVPARRATEDPVADVVEAGLVFRRFALEHPALFSVAFHRASARSWPLFRDAAVEAFNTLAQWFQPLAAQGLLGDRSVSEAAQQFDALCEGLAWMELRGNPLQPDPESFWRSAITALVTGFGSPFPHRPNRN
jgi:AcrR family transcriptional regulator